MCVSVTTIGQHQGIAIIIVYTMCIVRVLTDVRLITITTMCMLTTHASGMFPYCCINKTIREENYITLYYNYIYYLTHEVHGTTLE